jgi:hypothetical protein
VPSRIEIKQIHTSDASVRQHTAPATRKHSCDHVTAAGYNLLLRRDDRVLCSAIEKSRKNAAFELEKLQIAGLHAAEHRRSVRKFTSALADSFGPDVGQSRVTELYLFIAC